MKKSEKSEVTTQWGMPLAIMILGILALLINFCVKGHTVTKNIVEERVDRTVQEYSGKFRQELLQMTAAGKPICDFMSGYSGVDEDMVMSSLNALCGNSNIYMAVYTDVSGRGISQDGKRVDLTGESYYNRELMEQDYFYAEEDSISGAAAIVSAVPVFKENLKMGVMYLYYPMERFAEILKDPLYVEDTFYLLSTGEGRIVNKLGFNSDFQVPEDLKSIFFHESVKKKESEQMWTEVSQSRSGNLVVEDNKKTIYMVYTPLKINDWYIVAGMNHENVENMVQQEWKYLGNTAVSLIFIVVVFFIFTVAVNVLNKVQYARHSKSLEHRADTDLLTELYNKIATEREIESYTKANPDAKGMLFLIDIDNFKKINDSMGHAFGDEVLRTLGRRLQLEFRKSDILGRIGGDEMIIFLKNIQDEGAWKTEAARVARIYQDIQVGEYVKYTVTASIGTALFPLDGKDFKSLYAAGDRALYKAKKLGKNQMAFCNEEIFNS